MSEGSVNDATYLSLYFDLHILVPHVLLRLTQLVCFLYYRTQGKLHMLSESCHWPRPRGTQRMCLPTNRPFLSVASVVVLDELLRQRTGIPMVKDVGLSNLQSLFQICLRMLRAMLKYVFLSVSPHLNYSLSFPSPAYDYLCSFRLRVWMLICSTYLTSK